MIADDVEADVAIIRLAGFEAVKGLHTWGKWQRQGSGGGKSPGLEGNLRSNRCPICYEKEDPCDACKYIQVVSETIDMKIVWAVEKAITYGTMECSADGGHSRVTNGCSIKERNILLNHYRGKVDASGAYRFPDLRYKRDRMGLPENKYDKTVADLTRLVWSMAKINLKC